MALDRIDFPTTPNPVAGDWAKIVSLVSKGFQNINSPLQVDGSNIPSGATFQVGGIIYYGTSDTSISGTSSDYVKIEPNSGDSSATALASFVSSLSGVTWNKVYNGYYDGDGNLYIFDEVKAILAGHLSGSYSKFSELWNAHLGQNLRTTDDVEFNSITVGTVNTGHGNNELYAMNQNVRTTDNVEFNNLTATGDVTVEGSTEHTVSTYGQLLVNKSSTELIPVGVYLFNASSVDVRLEIYRGSSWTTATVQFTGGMIFSDGSNVRFNNKDATYDAGMEYRKF